MSDLFMNMQRDAQRRWHRSTAPGGSAASFTSHGTGVTSAPPTSASASAAGAHRMRRNASALTNGDAASTSGRDFENLLSLQLRKPKHWKWELSTSRSCTNIALPRILLYNHKGELLVDASGEQEQCIRQDDVVPPSTTRRSRSDTRSGERTPSRDGSSSLAASFAPKRTGRAATANLAHSIRRALDRELSGLHIEEATPSPTSASVRSGHTTHTLNSPIDFYTNELPDYALGRRSSSLKGVRFRVSNGEAGGTSKLARNSPQPNGYPLVDLPTPPSTATPTTTTTASSSSGTREKRRYRRSHSSGRTPANSRSILERMSYSRGRYSSPETEMIGEQELQRAPRYFLRSSKAGTLMLREESFTQHRRRRRKAKGTSSSEHLPSEDATSVKQRAASYLRLPELALANGREGGSLQDISELPERQQRGKQAAIRRFRSDGNVLLHKPTPSSSETDDYDYEYEYEHGGGYGDKQRHGNSDFHNFPTHTGGSSSSKRDDLPTIDSGNEIASGWTRPTRR